MILPDLSRRVRLPELMDDPGLDPGEHRRALEALARVSRVSRTGARAWASVRSVAAASRDRPVRVLDLACGGGDVVVELARRAAGAGLALEAHGCDVSGTALERARDQAGRAGVPARFFRLDALEDPVPEGYHLITASLFLHHLEHASAVGLLTRLAGAARSGLVQDLRRTRTGYLLAWSGLRLLSRSRVARVDGPRSVRAGFTKEEMAAMAAEAGIPRARVSGAWPQRLVLSWGHA